MPKMINKLNVLIVGYYGAGNAGDELLLKIILNALPVTSRAVVLSVNPRHTEDLHKTKSISLFRVDEVFEQMLGCQLLIFGGGGLMQTTDSFTQKALLKFDESEVSAYVRPFLMAKQLGVRTLVWAQGVGPLGTPDSKKIVKRVVDCADVVSVRDEESLKLLQDCGVVRDILVAPDPVWTISGVRSKREHAVTVDSKKNLVITLRPWALQSDEWTKNLAAAINRRVDPAVFRIIWLPFIVTPENLNPEFVSAERQVIELVQLNISSDFKQEIVFPNSFDELLESLTLADYAISMRLHAQILHHVQCTPVIGIQYDLKMEYASNAVGHNAALRVRLDADPSSFDHALDNLLQLDSGQMIDVKKKDASIAFATQHIELLDQSLNNAFQDVPKCSIPIDQTKFDWLQMWIGQQPLLQKQILKTSLDKSLSAIEVLKSEIDHMRLESDSQRLAMQHALDFKDQKISERDVKIVDCDAQLKNEIQKNLDSIRILKLTWSWRLTRPLRFFKHFSRHPTKAVYLAAKTIYWQLSPRTRNQLAGLRDPILRWFHPRLSKIQVAANGTDISWETFTRQVMAKRDSFKGVYIQECVIDWAVPLYQRPQHIASAMGRLNYLVIYRTNNWSDDNVNGFREVAPNVWLTNCEEVDTIEFALRSVYSTAMVEQHRIEKFPASCCVAYEYIDHIDPEISGDAENIKRLTKQKQRMLSGGAKFIVASATKLANEVSKEFDATKVFLIPNGVEVLHYRNQHESRRLLPKQYLDFCEKYEICIGYFGAMAPWLDYPLINELVKMRPDVGFVFIGPDYFGGQAQVKLSTNVLMTGAVPYGQLPAYATKFDVCWIPFKSGEIAKSTSPLKLFEYFALEKPVIVGTDMQECTVYPEVLHGQTSRIMSEHIDFANKLCKDSVDFRTRLRRLADESDWGRRATAYSQAFEAMQQR